MDLDVALVREIGSWATRLVKETLVGGFCGFFIWMYLGEKRRHLATLKSGNSESRDLLERYAEGQQQISDLLEQYKDILDKVLDVLQVRRKRK